MLNSDILRNAPERDNGRRKADKSCFRDNFSCSSRRPLRDEMEGKTAPMLQLSGTRQGNSEDFRDWNECQDTAENKLADKEFGIKEVA